MIVIDIAIADSHLIAIVVRVDVVHVDLLQRIIGVAKEIQNRLIT